MIINQTGSAALKLTGQVEESIKFGEALDKGMLVNTTLIESATYTRLANPAVLPTEISYCCAWSPDGTRLAVTYAGDPSIVIYDTTTTPYTKIADPEETPFFIGGFAKGCAWSPDGTRLAVATDEFTYLIVYDTTVVPYVRCATGPTPTGAVNGCAWNPAGTRLALTHYGSPYLTVYDTTVTPYVKLTNPVVTPSGVGMYNNSCAWNKSGTRLAVAHAVSPYITVYDTTTTPYTKLANPSVLPSGEGFCCAWNPAGTRLAVGHYGGVNNTIYDTTTTPYTKIADPISTLGGKPYGCSWSPDGTRLAYTKHSPEYVIVYDVTNVPYVAAYDVINYAIGPTGEGCGCAWSPDGVHLALSSTSPSVIVYKAKTKQAYAQDNTLADLPDVIQLGYTKEAGAEGDVKQCVLLFDVPPGMVSTADADATSSDIRTGKTAYVDGSLVTGTFEPIVNLVNSVTWVDAGSIFTAREKAVGFTTDGKITIVVQGANSTSYENIYFIQGTLPSGVTMPGGYSSSWDTSTVAGQMYGCILAGITGPIDLTLTVGATNSTYDYYTITVSAVYA